MPPISLSTCLTISGAAILLGCAGEPRVLEPRTPPSREMPAVVIPPALPPANHGRIVLDTTDGPMRMTMQYDPTFKPPGAQQPATRTGELCTTPCVVDLPVGRYRLYMTQVQGEPRGDSDDLVVADGLTIYRRAPGTFTTPNISEQAGPGIVTLAGLVATVVGTVMIAQAQSKNDGTPAGGVVLLGAGIAAAIGGGIWLYDASRAKQQDGATTMWQQPRSP